MTRPEDIDWYEIERRLMHGTMRLRPWEIDRLTVPELVLALDSDLETRRAPGGGVALGKVMGDREAYATWWRSMTPLERLNYYRES